MMTLSSSDHYLLRDILKRVSRSFYLTIAILPQAVRNQVALAYLLARAADSIADSGRLDDTERLQALRQFKKLVQPGKRDEVHILELTRLGDTAEFPSDEKRLLDEIGHCFSLLEKFHPKDQDYIAQVLSVLISGMEFDIDTFPRGQVSTIHVLPNWQDLEFYTYSVAGCVGEFWTHLMCAHLPGFRRWEPTAMCPLGIRFGKGLQMVNILRDLPQDLRKGRCYIPLALLSPAGLSPQDLLEEKAWDSLKPLYRQLLGEARDHLDQGWRYTLTVPTGEVRLRLACMWPILIGIQTLQRLSVSEHILNPQYRIKVSRPDVYRILGATGLTGGCRFVGNVYWGYWRKRIV